MADPLLPPLPTAISRAIRNPVGLTVKDLSQQLRASRAPLSAADHADALDKLQDYLDGLQTDLSSVMAYLQSISATPTPASDTTAPADVLAISVVGSYDPISGYATISVSVTPPAAPFDGCHLFVEIPDGSAAAAFTIGTSDLSGTDPVSGQWTPKDLQQQPYVAAQQPWTLTFPIPANLDLTTTIPCRLYAVSYTTAIENALIQFGQVGASPSQTFSLAPQAVINAPPASGTNVTANTGPIVATVLTADNSNGKLRTPVYVVVGSAPTTITGWVGQLVLTYDTADPTLSINQFPVGPIFKTAGLVNAGSDGISVAHSFAVDTPTSIQHATVWAKTGLVDATGNYQWNNIVPGITPSFPITIGTTSGTIDAASVLTTSIETSMAVVAGKFGVATGGITNPLLGALAVDAGKLANSAVTSTKIANLAVGTAAIALLAVDNTLIANATITGAKIASATIAGANIASATIVDANIANLDAGKVTTGTLNANNVTITGTGGGFTTSISGTSLTTASGTFTQTWAPGSISMLDSSGSGTNAVFGATKIHLDFGGAEKVAMLIAAGNIGAIQFGASSNYALWAGANALKVVGGSTSFSSGTKTIATGLTSISYAIAMLGVSGSAPTEYCAVDYGATSGGSLVLRSSNASSSAVLYWLAIGAA